MADMITKGLLDFIKQSPCNFYAIANLKKQLKDQGYEELFEGAPWKLKEGGRYFTTRNSSAIIAFKLPKFKFKNFQLIATHSDSPSFKIKENPDILVKDHYVQLNCEKYGGMIMSTWLDRPLSIAGRLIVKKEKRYETLLVNVKRDLLMIPNLAMHMNREINKGYQFNPQVDTLPLLGEKSAKGNLMAIIAEAAGVNEKDILGNDLFLYNRMPGTVWGAENDFISAPRLDDLQCVYAAFEAFLNGGNPESVSIFSVFDNEEVGSNTKQGADSNFLKDTLTRINLAANRSEEEYYRAMASSFMVSADNGHALHPNHSERSDPTNHPLMNQGVIIKYNANQRYATDAVSAALFKEICTKAKVPYQNYANRSDSLGGSTLGNISSSHVSMNTVDIGLAQLAMHSAYETVGAKDTAYLIKALEKFYSTEMTQILAGSYKLA